jgi:hypothetical protein
MTPYQSPYAINTNSSEPKQNINYFHPSVNTFKSLPSYPSRGDTGSINTKNPIDTTIKTSNEAAHASIADKNVMFNGIYALDSNSPQLSSLVKTTDLPAIDQQGDECQIISFLHMIQSQLDFPMDYNHLLNCLPSTPPPKIKYPWSADLMKGTAYYQLGHLLHSPGKCFSVGKLVCGKGDQQNIGVNFGSTNCDDPCSTTIRIESRIIEPTKTYEELCSRLQQMGVVSLHTVGITSRRVNVASVYNIPWDEIKDYDHDELDSVTGQQTSEEQRNKWNTIGHELSVVGCSDNRKIIIKNSLGGEDALVYIPYADIVDSANNFVLPREQNKPNKLWHNIYPVVKKCPDISTSVECRNLICKEAGYDKAKPSIVAGECECECDVIASPTPTFGIGECLNSGPVQKIFDPIIGRCRCPDPPDVGHYYDQNCCLKEAQGSWCDGDFGDCINGSYSEFLMSTAAIAWKSHFSCGERAPCPPPPSPPPSDNLQYYYDEETNSWKRV